MARRDSFEKLYFDYVSETIQPTYLQVRSILDAWKTPAFWRRRRGRGKAIPEPIQRIRYRVKRAESIVDKMLRQPRDFPGGPNAQNLRRMRDVLGARIITYIPDHIRLVDHAIRVTRAFELSPEVKPRLYLQEDSVHRLGFKLDDFEYKGPKDSGYASIHYFVRLKDPVAHENPWFELQVRTMLEEVWAEIEHQLGYKQQQQTEFSVSRQFRVISHQLRAADDHFDFLYDRLLYLQSQSNPKDEDKLNAENLPRVLGEFEVVVQQGDIGGLISILTSNKVENVGDLRRRLRPEVLAEIRNCFRELRPREELTAFHIVATAGLLEPASAPSDARDALTRLLSLQEVVTKSRDVLFRSRPTRTDRPRSGK